MSNMQQDIVIEIHGNRFFSSQYLLKEKNATKNRADVERLTKTIIRKYTEAGFAFCRIYPSVIYSNNSIEKVVFMVEENKRIMVADYLFDIQGRTDLGPVRKVADIKPGTYFSSRALSRTKKNLIKTEVFSSVQENIVLKDGEYYVLLELKEEPGDNLTAYGALSEDKYDFSIIYGTKNLLGTLRRLSFQYDYKTLFSLDFTEPILIHPIALNGNFSLWTYDSVRLVKFTGQVTAPIGEYFDISLISGVESFSYFGDDSSSQRYSDKFAGIGLGFDYASSFWSCSQQTRYEYLLRQYDRWRFQNDAEFQIVKINVRPHYYFVETDSFEYFDYYRIGGAQDLRGYLEEEFYTRSAVWVNFEYKKLFIYPLFDIGRIQDEIKYSYGFGMTIASNALDAAIIFAWPKQGTWRDGKIHLMLETGF